MALRAGSDKVSLAVIFFLVMGGEAQRGRTEARPEIVNSMGRLLVPAFGAKRVRPLFAVGHARWRNQFASLSKIALSVALVLATASAAVAAPKHAVRHQTAVERQVPANPWLSFGSVRPANSANEPTYMNNEDSRECFDGESCRRAAALGGKAYRDRPRLPPDGDGHRGRVCLDDVGLQADQLPARALVSKSRHRGLGHRARCPCTHRGRQGLLDREGNHDRVTRLEFEYAIPIADATTMLDKLCEQPLIEKTRYREEFQGHVWEVDEFHGDNDGLLIAEVEVADESETFALPSWVGAEVSNDPHYFNANLVSNPYKNWRVPNVDEVSFALRNPRR
jgi:CYTH domain-containing protein